MLVEPSGIYDMDEFFDVLHEEPLDRWYEIGNVIAVVDARLEDALSPEAEYLLASQAANAGCMILSKCDTATEEQRRNTIAHLKRSLTALGCKQRADQKVLCEGAEPLPDQDFATILSCGYHIASYEKPDFAKGQSFESLYFLDYAPGRGCGYGGGEEDAERSVVRTYFPREGIFAEFGRHMAGDQCNTAGDHAKADCKRAGRSDCDRREACGRRHPGVLERLETDDDLCGDGALSGGTRIHSGTGIKKEHGVCAFEVFDNENAGIRLVVTGVGEIAAAAVVAAVCARDGADAADFLINIGCCAAANAGADSGCETVDSGMDSGYGAAHAAQIGDLYVCHKITEQATPGKRSIRIFCTGTRGRNVNL